MKKVLLKSFSLSSLFIGSIFSLTSNAQIVYTDVNPDITTSGSYNLDLNNDGIIDFVIQHTSGTVNGKGNCKGQSAISHYIKVTPLNNNQVLDTGGNPKRMFASSIINSTQSSWSSQANQLMISYEPKCTYFCFWGQCYYTLMPTANGQWLTPVEDGFLGLRLNYGGHSYFGWVRIDISRISYGAENFTIEEYAIKSNADQAILAGQSSAEYLGVSTVAGPLCAGNNITVPYIIAGTFSPSSVVTAELSDATGSFASPVTIGSLVSNVSGNINALIPPSTATGYQYRIRVTSSEPVKVSYPNANNISINGDPIWINAPNYNTSLCSGDVFLEIYSDNSCPGSYQWKRNGIDIPGAISQSYSPTISGDYCCVKTIGVRSVSSNIVTVIADPPSIVIFQYPSPCIGYVDLYTPEDSALQWKLNGVDIPGATAANYRAITSGNYTCVKSNLCGNATSNTISVTINPSMADATITAAGPTVVCNGPVTLNANTGTGLSYQWYPHYDSISATNSSYTPSTTGSYYVIETNANGCTRQSNAISLIIGKPVTHTIYPSSGSICQGNPVYLYTDYYFPYYSYQWTKDGNDISGATSYNYAAKQPGTYAVRVSASGGCSSVSAGVIITHGCNAIASSKLPTSNELENPALNEQKLKIAPNPASSQTQISFTTTKPGKVLLNLFDIDGKLIKIIADRNFEAGTHQLLLDTKSFIAGIYILKMQAEASVFTKKLVVVK